MTKANKMFKTSLLATLFYSSNLIAAAYFPVNIENQTNIASDQNLYVVVKASISGKDCIMSFDDNGKGQCEIISPDTPLNSYSYPLSKLTANEGKITLYLPQVDSGRIYFSLNYPLDLHIDKKTNRIVDPDGFKPRDNNYYTLYDKVEFTFNKDGTWINPTAVDFFSIPITIEQKGAVSELNKAGLSKPRADILQQVKQQFTQYDMTTNHEWNHLFLSYDDTILRLISPGKAMIKGIPNTQPFDPDYLNNESRYGFSYIDNLWEYYKTHTLQIDCSEIAPFMKLDDYLFTGRVENDQFIFSNQSKTSTVAIAKPSLSRAFFAGAGDSFDAENNTPKAIIVRQLTSAFEVGFLPAPDKTLINQEYFKTHKNHYYQNNDLWPSVDQGPWYDLYSKALHSFNEAIYTFAYDDALAQDGTLHDSNGNNPSPVTISLGDMSGTRIIDPYSDQNTYTVTPVIGDGSIVMYKGHQLQSNQAEQDVTIPMHVTVNGTEADIYISPQMVRPFFEAADGIVINKTSEKAATIIFPGK